MEASFAHMRISVQFVSDIIPLTIGVLHIVHCSKVSWSLVFELVCHIIPLSFCDDNNPHSQCTLYYIIIFTAFDFPQINYKKFNGKKYNFVYGVTLESGIVGDVNVRCTTFIVILRIMNYEDQTIPHSY